MSQTKHTRTGQEAYRWGMALLCESGLDPTAAKAEARWILEKAWNRSGIRLVASLADALEESSLEKYRELIMRRAAHEPLQYILGEQEFMGLTLQVTPAVLIPRQDTEVIVKAILQLYQGRTDLQILELGTGSGAIAVSLAYYLPDSRITAVDISAEALTLARSNGEKTGTAEKIAFLQGDLFDPLPEGRKYDLIVSNPPYISAEEYAGLPEEVRREPRQALWGGPDGLDFYRRIISLAPVYLLPQGRIFLEIGWKQAADVRHLLEKNGFSEIKIWPDKAGRDRAISALDGTS